MSDNIKNKHLKLLQINDLVRKVDVLFNFPSTSYSTCNRTYGKTMYVPNCKYTNDYTHLCNISNMRQPFTNSTMQPANGSRATVVESNSIVFRIRFRRALGLISVILDLNLFSRTMLIIPSAKTSHR